MLGSRDCIKFPAGASSERSDLSVTASLADSENSAVAMEEKAVLEVETRDVAVLEGVARHAKIISSIRSSGSVSARCCIVLVQAVILSKSPTFSSLRNEAPMLGCGAALW